MAERYWDGGTSTDHADVNNWSDTDGGGTPASSVPGTGDHAHFTTNGDTNPCTLTANWALGDLTILAGYGSKFDMATFNLTMDDGGNITLNGAGNFDCGTGTITLTNGDFDNKDVGTFTRGTSTVVMNGTGNLVGTTANSFHNLTIALGAVITLTEHTLIFGLHNVLGTFSIASSKYILVGGTTSIGASGKITGSSGTYRVYMPGAGKGITSFAVGGVVDVGELQIDRPHSAAVFAPGTYSPTLLVVKNVLANPYTFTLSSGDYVFTGNVEFENTDAGGTLTIANDTNDPNITIQGDVIFTETAGTITYTKGDGTITASGGSAQDWDWGDQTLEDIVVAKSAGTLTFSGAWTADSYTQTTSSVDVNGQTLETTGDWQMTGGAAADPGGSAITVGGTFRAGGVDLDGGSGWTLDVTGKAEVRGLSVAHCDASGGSAVHALACKDAGNNTNLVFATGRNRSRHHLLRTR